MAKNTAKYCPWKTIISAGDHVGIEAQHESWQAATAYMKAAFSDGIATAIECQCGEKVKIRVDTG